MYALDRANMHIYPGEFVSIIGPSGSGKSTMMNIIGCLDVADGGEYLLDGQAIEQYSERELAKIRNRKIGFIFQNFNLIQRMTAEENVELPLIYQGVRAAERKSRVRDALESVGLSKRSGHRPSELSGGQQQRVAIARALMQQAKVILADEPIASLDPESARIVMDTLRDINQNDGITVVVTLHQVDYALRYCERIVALRQGHVFYDGCSQQFDNERFDHLYRSINRVEENAKAA